MPEFTPNQKLAISARNSNILITAAAGSGKTTVLAARIAALIEEGADINRMLVCTFTQAAAAEMKTRIADTLARRSEETGNLRLAAQAELAVNADICTIHSFAQRVIKENFAHIGVSADLRVAGEEETASLKEQACSAAFDALYEEDDPDFLLLREYCGGRTDDRTAKLVKEHFAFLSALPEGLSWYDRTGGEEWKNALKKELREYTASKLEYMLSIAETIEKRCFLHISADADELSASTALKKQLLEEIAGTTEDTLAAWFTDLTPTRRKKTAEIFTGLSDEILDMAETAHMGADALFAAHRATFSRMLHLAREREELANSAKWAEQYARALDDTAFVRALCGSQNSEKRFREILFGGSLSRLRSGLLPEEDKNELKVLRELLKDEYKELLVLYELDTEEALELDAEYARLMAEAVKSVVSRFMEEFSRRKRERGIMDFDDMLSLAFEALKDNRIAEVYRARYDHVFMDEYQDTNPLQEYIIGSVSRENGRFLVGDMKQSIYRFRMADPLIFRAKEQDYLKGEGRVIYMNDNFRSSDEVCALTNFIMKRLMSPILGEIEYSEGQELIARAGTKGSTELMLTRHNDAPDAESPVAQEARTVAAKLLSFYGTPITKGGETVSADWGDMAVLVRKTKGVAEVFSRVFREYGIPFSTGEKQASIPVEIEIFVDMLRVISGTFSDIALISLLRGPVGGLSERELALIRMELPRERYWDAFLLAAKQEGSPAARVYETIKRWRVLERGLTPADLILCIKNETDYEAWLAAGEGGIHAAANFRAFFDKLMALAGEYASLFELTAALDSVKKEKGVYADLTSSEESGAVRLMSVHKSKGLEFPITVLALTDQGFSTKDTSPHMLTHSAIGLTADIIDSDDLTVTRPLSRSIMEYIIKRESRSEELRILYVALTRAKQHLVISGLIRSDADLYVHPSCDPLALMSRRTTLDWVLAALASLQCMQDVNIFAGGSTEFAISHCVSDALLRGARTKETERSPEEIIELAKDSPAPEFSEYGYMGVPGKISVTSLLPEYEPPTPRSSDGRGGMRAGTLVHLFLEKVKVGESKGDVEKAIASLVKKELLTEEDARILRGFAPELSSFLKGDLAKRIAAAEKVMREIPFTAHLSAIDPVHSELTEPVVIQGIIDLAFKEADGWVVLDYKSNYAGDDESLSYLTSHYRRQLELYGNAWTRLTGENVKEKYLYFVRGDRLVKLD